MARLAALGMGIADNTRPAEISLLRWVIDQLAVAYANAPTRWLIGGNSKRLAESNADIVAMRRTLKRSRYDRSWRFADRMRALCGQVVMRYFAIDRQAAWPFERSHPTESTAFRTMMRLMRSKQITRSRFDFRTEAQRCGNVMGTFGIARVADNGMFLDDAKQPFSESGFVRRMPSSRC